MAFSERLEELLKEHKVTWKEVYTTLHIGKNQKKYWADKGISPDMETLLKLAEYFNVTPDYLRGTDELKQSCLSTLDSQTLTLTAEEVRLVLKYRALDKEGRTMVESTLIQETRRMSTEKGETVSAG
jgi:transcriptional regulator with XRE-family HTH domain|nr:MAG TPA: Cro/C1-type HTH DNA-binding domain protein [Caudoviricetes sp.]